MTDQSEPPGLSIAEAQSIYLRAVLLGATEDDD